MGTNHPVTLITVMNIAIVYNMMEDYGKAEGLYQRALEGREAQLGRDHEDTMRCAENHLRCLEASDDHTERLEELLIAYPWLRHVN